MKRTIIAFLMPALLAVFLIVVALSHFGGAMAGSDGLVLPYDLPPASAKIPRPEFQCPAPPAAAMEDLEFASRYDQSDPHRAMEDPEASREYARATAALYDFQTEVILMANNHLRYRNVDPVYAVCVLDWLHDWAREDALLGEVNNTGVAVRQWSLASLSSAYAQVRPDPALDRKKRRAVDKWLVKVAHEVIEDYPEDSPHGRHSNNHLYWAAWAVLMTGIAVDERDLYDWGIGRASFAVEKLLHGDGTFPLELGRGQKALHYHKYAAIPLFMIAEAGLRNGDDLYAIRDGVLHRLARRILMGIEDPEFFSLNAGQEQEAVQTIWSGNYAWMEVYNSRFPRADVRRQLKKIRPIFMRMTGGDMTYLYGRDQR